MYEPCVSGEFTITVLSVAVILLIVVGATLWAMLDRCMRSLKPTKDQVDRLRNSNWTLRQENGALKAELRSYQARAQAPAA